jgi:hypothetical protein
MPFVPRRAVLGSILLAAAGMAAAGTAFAEDGEYVKSYRVTGVPEVNIRADDARVRVVTADVSEVEFRVTYTGYTLGTHLEIDSRKEGDVIELTERIHRQAFKLNYPHWEARDVSIEVRMPKRGDLRITTGDGDVRVESFTGPVSVRTGDGDVEARQLNGTISLAAGDGDIRADGVKGDVRLRTGDGSIDGTNVDGDVQAWSGDGQIDLAGRFTALGLRTGDGGVRARINDGSEMHSSWSISSTDGDVDVILPKSFRADLHATTNDGRIEVGEPLKLDESRHGSKVRGVMNGGGMSFLIRTSDGRIRIGTR